MKIPGSNRDSECMYCGSKSFGASCPYSPNKMHVHMDLGGKACVWCGSKSIGDSCPYNPFSKTHQRGITYNPIMAEALENGITQGVIMKTLSTPISEMPAYKMGLIDDCGNSIRDPETIEERKSMTGVDRYLIKVKNLLDKKLDILNLSLYYENLGEDTLEDIERLYPIELQCRDEIGKCVSYLSGIASEYSSKGISIGKFEQMVVEALLDGKKM